jgi:superfamily II RNA helicase
VSGQPRYREGAATLSLRRAEECRDAVPDLPVHDDLELVLRASEMTAAASSSAAPAAAPPTPRLRPMDPTSPTPFAIEGSLADVNAAFDALRPRLAMTWPFELDGFQKEGVVLMEAGESVLVAAHTSAGLSPSMRPTE